MWHLYIVLAAPNKRWVIACLVTYEESSPSLERKFVVDDLFNWLAEDFTSISPMQRAEKKWFRCINLQKWGFSNPMGWPELLVQIFVVLQLLNVGFPRLVEMEKKNTFPVEFGWQMWRYYAKLSCVIYLEGMPEHYQNLKIQDMIFFLS